MTPARLCRSTLLLALVGLCSPAMATPDHSAPATPSVPLQRKNPFAELPAQAQHMLTAWQAPGMAIAVVQDHQVVFLSGFGQRRKGNPAAVDSHTRFAIASLTKTFTAAVVGMLAEEGKLRLDAPIKESLIGFTLQDPVATEQLSLRDILSHRSGIDESADLLWSGTGYDRNEVLRRLREVPQAAPLRSQFSYSNVMYVLAGERAASASGQSFESLIRSRILEPVQMTESGFGIPTAPDGNIASPHTQRNAVITPIAPRILDNIAPAAGLYASATDLSRWLQVWLQRGRIEEKQVLNTTLIDAMMTPQTLVGLRPWAKALYPQSHFLAHGFGWMLQDYRGQMVVWNTGGIDGFSCTLALLPEEKFGVAVLTNVPWTGLPEAMAFHLIDSWLGSTGKDWSGIRLKMSKDSRARQQAAQTAQQGQQTTTTFAIPTERFVGKYLSPLLGEALITASKDGLRLRIAKSLTGKLSPWQANRLRLQFDDAELGAAMATFTTSPDGFVQALSLEEHGTFTRVPQN